MLYWLVKGSRPPYMLNYHEREGELRAGGGKFLRRMPLSLARLSGGDPHQEDQFLTIRLHLKDITNHRRNLPTLETGLRGLKTVFHTVINVVQQHQNYDRFHHLPRFKAPGQTADRYIGEKPSVSWVLLFNMQ